MAHLVFQTAFPGDVFLSIPLLKHIRDWDPQSKIVLACRPGLGEVFLRAGLVNEVIEINKRTGSGRKSAMQKIKSQEWDVVFVPHESVRTALWMLGVRARRAKIGFRKWWNFLMFTHRVSKPSEFPDALRQLSLLTPLDSGLAEKFATPDFADLRSPKAQTSPLALAKVPEWASMRVEQHKPQGRRIFLAPGSVWATKRWTLQGYEQLARALIQRGYSVELVGSPPEKGLCDQIVSRVPGVLNHAGETSLAELVTLLAQGTALICNDSGAMHAAAAGDVPTVAIFGPTILAQGFRPWQSRAVVVQRELGCRPCGKHGAEKCPIGTHECMEKISHEEVLAALDVLLKSISDIP